MLDVREEQIKNTTICEKFFNIPNVHRMITTPQLLFIGRVVRNLVEQIPLQLLTSWICNKRKRGDPLYNNRRTIVESLKMIFLNKVNKIGSLNTWAQHATDGKH